MKTSSIVNNMTTVVNDANTPDADKIAALCQAVKDLVGLLDDTSRSSTKKFPLAKQRGIEQLPKFNGTRTDFVNWSRRVEVFLGDDMDLKNILKALRTTKINQTTEFNEIDFISLDITDMGPGKMKQEMVDWYKYNLHAFLMTVTQGTAYSLVDMTDEDGFLARQRPHREYANITPQGKRSLLGKVLQHPKAKGYEDVIAVQAECEKALIKYHQACGDGAKLAEDIKTTAYLQILPEKIAENIRNLEGEEKSLSDIMKHVRKLVHTHVNPMAEQKPVPMESNCLTQDETPEKKVQFQDDNETEDAELNYMKGGKGKSKGKGFQGNCYFCQEPGHSKAHCPKLDKIMSESRAKVGTQQQYGQQQWSGGNNKGYQPQQPFGGKGKGGGKSNFGSNFGKGGYGQQWSGGGKGYQQPCKGQGKGYQPQSIYGLDFLDGHQQQGGYDDYQNCMPAFSITSEEQEPPQVVPVPEVVVVRHRARTAKKLCPKACCVRLPQSEIKIGNRFDALGSIDENEIDLKDFPQATSEKTKIETKMPKMPKIKTRSQKKKEHNNIFATDAKVEQEINLLMAKLDAEPS